MNKLTWNRKIWEKIYVDKQPLKYYLIGMNMNMNEFKWFK